jgi:hypothetical protein
MGALLPLTRRAWIKSICESGVALPTAGRSEMSRARTALPFLGRLRFDDRATHVAAAHRADRMCRDRRVTFGTITQLTRF